MKSILSMSAILGFIQLSQLSPFDIPPPPLHMSSLPVHYRCHIRNAPRWQSKRRWHERSVTARRDFIGSAFGVRDACLEMPQTRLRAT
ncbi:hypothetical protein CALVIDRAFT_543193 [Calocera viscosa TUFC12733]|uniref:Secreted protein n=1 Tax=Calocera viscosa (strain TUFC12733) TaxID=1330018 RepID=A0A167FUY3_CALVF|nr:hypothetical protein CALVIDRAFT_543193 [Calocera viscosa TUFC12733]